MLLLAVAAAQENGGPVDRPSWVYSHSGGDSASPADQDETWSDGDCIVGRLQSPIDIETSAVTPSKQLNGGIQAYLTDVPMLLINSGHGFQLHETEPTNDHSGAPDTTWRDELSFSDAMDGAYGQAHKGYTMLRGQRYNFYQVHWHTPSENTIDGEHFALEAHFVHQLDDAEWDRHGFDGTGTLVGSLDHLAVVGVMYELAEECNAVLDEFWHKFPHDTNPAGPTVEEHDGVISLDDIIEPLLGDGYYHWHGSLTTPPCTEGVDWNLLKRRLPICERQVEQLRAALGFSQRGVRVNNRATQPLNQRFVLETSHGTSPPLGATSVLLLLALAASGCCSAYLLFAMCRMRQQLQRRAEQRRA